MWYHLYDGPDETVGPLVAAWLQCKAQKLALQLRLPRPDGAVDTGSDALVRLPVDEVRDPQNPQVIIQHHIPSGIQALCDKLRETFGQNDLEMASRSLESFFELRRGRLSLQEYAVEFDLRMEEAHDRAGLEMNEVALFYFFFKNSGLSSRFVEDVKLQVHGDLRRYQEARSLALRLSTKAEGENFYQDDMSSATSPEHNGFWDFWGEEWNEGYEDDCEDAWSSWYGEEDYYDPMEEYEGEWPDGEEHAEEQADESGCYPVKGGKKGRGNAMGVGCSICRSKCVMPGQQQRPRPLEQGQRLWQGQEQGLRLEGVEGQRQRLRQGLWQVQRSPQLSRLMGWQERRLREVRQGPMERLC